MAGHCKVLLTRLVIHTGAAAAAAEAGNWTDYNVDSNEQKAAS